MMSKINLFKPSAAKAPSLLHEVYAAHKPPFFIGSYTGSRWRHKSMGKTLDFITNTNKLRELEKQAEVNLNQWAKKEILHRKQWK